MKDTICFLGPTLPHEEARQILDAEYHPPARMGDLYRLLSARLKRIIIIDGVFHGVPSVWHREILEALTEGIEVIGASSMGALRAAELHGLGMKGIGQIFEWYRDGLIDGDDEVALVHGEGDTGFRALSTPLVNLRATFFKLTAGGHVSATESVATVEKLKSLAYPDRSTRALDPALARLVTRHFVDIKRVDAVRALEYAAAHPPSVPATSLSDGHRSERSMWRIGRSLRGTVADCSGQALVGMLDDHERRPLETSLAKRSFLVAYADMQGLSSPQSQTDVPAAAWLDANGLTAAAWLRLNRAREVADWLATQNSTDTLLAEWARAHGLGSDPNGITSDEALAKWLIDEGPAHFGLPFLAEAAIADELRLTGRAAKLASGYGLQAPDRECPA